MKFASQRQSRNNIINTASGHWLTPKMFAALFVAAEGLAVTLIAFLIKLTYIDLYLGDASTSLSYAGACVLLGGLAIACLNVLGAADEKKMLARNEILPTVFFPLAMAYLGLIVVLFLVKSTADYSRVWLVLSFALSLGTLLAGRLAAPAFASRLRQSGQISQRVAIYGTPPLAKQVERHLQQDGLFVDSVIFHSDRPGDSHNSLDALIARGKANEFASVIIALPPSAEKQLHDAMSGFSVLPFEIQIYNEASEFPRRIYGIENLGNLSLLIVQRQPLGDLQVIAKRLLDIVGATIGIALLLPALPVIAFAIKWESRGPVFFVQRRHGFNHKVINVWKFRTMTVTEDGPHVRQAEKNDVRITKVGAFLRKSSIDELPQLINVIRGDMSLVGPRPHAVAHNHEYGQVIDRYANRHRVKPGITGLAQIHGYRGNTRDTELMRRRIEYDLKYIEHWSAWNDLKIIFQTALKMVTGALAEKDVPIKGTNVPKDRKSQRPSVDNNGAAAANQNSELSRRSG